MCTCESSAKRHNSTMRLWFLIFGAGCLQFATASYENNGKFLDTRTLEDHLKAVTRRLELVESRDKTQQAEIDSLRAKLQDYDSVKAELQEQKERTATLEKLVDNLQARKDDVEDVSKAEEDTGVKLNESKLMPSQRWKRADIMRGRQVENEMPVAFFATLGHNVLHAGPNQAILFENVITNLGNAYTPSLGAFIAPVTGTYVFSVTLTAYGIENEHYNLCKNGKAVSSLYSHGSTAPHIVTSQTAVLQLNKGDNIEIQNQDADGSVQASYSSFAGFLLQQDYNAAPVVGK